MGRLFRNLGEAFLTAGVAVLQNGSKAPRGPLQIGRELRSTNLPAAGATGLAEASPAAINNPKNGNYMIGNIFLFYP